MQTARMHCGHCGEEAKQRCGSCRTTKYCTPECQQADWRLHKLVCKQWAQFQKRPSDDVRRVILLPDKDSKPTFLWMPVKHIRIEPEDDEEVSLTPQQWLNLPLGAHIAGETVFGPKGKHPEFVKLVTGKLGSGKLLDHNLFLTHLDYFMDLPSNPCLGAMVGPGPASRWRGPLVICASGRTKYDDPLDLRDIDLSGFTLALNRVVTYHSGKDIPIQKTQGVKFNTTAPFVEEVNVPFKHPVFQSTSLLPIMERFEWPVRTYTYPTTTPTTAVSGSSSSATEPAIFDAAVLRICLDSSSPEFGKVPASFHEDSASVLLAHVDKAELDVSVLASISQFVKKWVFPELGNAPSDKEGREEVLRHSIDERLAVQKILGAA